MEAKHGFSKDFKRTFNKLFNKAKCNPVYKNLLLRYKDQGPVDIDEESVMDDSSDSEDEATGQNDDVDDGRRLDITEEEFQLLFVEPTPDCKFSCSIFFISQKHYCSPLHSRRFFLVWFFLGFDILPRNQPGGRQIRTNITLRTSGATASRKRQTAAEGRVSPPKSKLTKFFIYVCFSLCACSC